VERNAFAAAAAVAFSIPNATCGRSQNSLAEPYFSELIGIFQTATVKSAIKMVASVKTVRSFIRKSPWCPRQKVRLTGGMKLATQRVFH